MPDISTADFMQRVVAFLDRYEQNLPPVPPVIDWSQTPAARWVGQGDGGWLKPLEVTAGHGVGELVGVDRQKALLEANTEQCVKGLPANNALLWAARATGKSSLVRALLAAWAEQGPRLTGTDWGHLGPLRAVVGQIADRPWRFLPFCEGLACGAGGRAYKAVRTPVAGSVGAEP